ncbi:MAG: TolC family protein [bacterium]|nr:TolC family protein [bacterium]
MPLSTNPLRPLALPTGLLLTACWTAGCWSPATWKAEADDQVYAILANKTARVTGVRKTVDIERPVDTLRRRLLESSEPVQLSLLAALDVAAENSREFQRQKEVLYLAALALTRARNDFELIYAGGGGGDISGVADQTAVASLRDDLGASINAPSGARIVGSFVNTFLRSVVNGENFDGSSILNLTLTQPLLRTAGQRVVQEPLLQAERDVIYAVRAFERFRTTFAVRIVTSYWNVAAQMANLAAVQANLRSLTTSRSRIEELFNAGRSTVTDFGRAQQSEFGADARRVSSDNSLQAALDRFKLQLGLPVTATIELDPTELDRLGTNVTMATIGQDDAIGLAVRRRFDHQNVIDEVADAGRKILVAENALEMILDFTTALSVPDKDGSSLNLDWSRVDWSAGFDLDLALNRINERNAYRSTLISFEVAIRNREQSQDQIAADVRASLRDMQTAIDSYNIQKVAVDLARQRVEATTDLYDAGRIQAFEKLDAQDDLLSAQLDLIAATVTFASARLQLMSDLEAINLEPQGLRFDPALPMPALSE